ncbi:hypothetical protein FNF27_01720 [Cafeteria roenbergensis]|uniref:peptide-methionine (S)-S-oxide reductase n=2 Tax=Cafeteria roenbergensis TaxID=33653 RepID=A0A5A8DSS5_CAFRO|nr:hypothetical protein FNF31_00689 [Cafeteria roenbergensis]KAA0176898.1 hypothetical protein FNF27_01720 [Cafeteria roenbergensis]
MAAAGAPAPGGAAGSDSTDGLRSVVLGAGCFWCVEAVFSQTPGVKKVESGYAGGKTKDPSYEQVCSGTTGHAEVVRLWFDPAVTTYEAILRVFFKAHDPTTLNRQGADTGTQYRSAVFYASDEERDTANALIKELNDSGSFSSPIVTEVTAGIGADPSFLYYSAEKYHQDYYVRNPGQGYCRAVIAPKLAKLGLKF